MFWHPNLRYSTPPVPTIQGLVSIIVPSDKNIAHNDQINEPMDFKFRTVANVTMVTNNLFGAAYQIKKWKNAYEYEVYTEYKPERLGEQILRVMLPPGDYSATVKGSRNRMTITWIDPYQSEPGARSLFSGSGYSGNCIGDDRYIDTWST